MPGGNISVIGPRMSGKTTYLAALAYHKTYLASHQKGLKYTITAQNPEARQLQKEAEEVLLAGSHFRANKVEEKSVFEYPFYAFSIEYQSHRFASPQKIELTTRDYPGEVFEKLEKSTSLGSKHEEFVNDCFKAKIGCVVLLTGWELGQDNKYRNMLRNFTAIMDRSNVTDKYKLAVVMSKCERGEIWSGRLEPERDLFHLHLPKTKEFLTEKISSQNLKFFALSTFGIMSKNNPRPNREDRLVEGEPASVLRDPSNWQPFNLIEPLLWISEHSES
jgi:hypothetical protein